MRFVGDWRNEQHNHNYLLPLLFFPSFLAHTLIQQTTIDWKKDPPWFGESPRKRPLSSADTWKTLLNVFHFVPFTRRLILHGVQCGKIRIAFLRAAIPADGVEHHSKSHGECFTGHRDDGEETRRRDRTEHSPWRGLDEAHRRSGRHGLRKSEKGLYRSFLWLEKKL